MSQPKPPRGGPPPAGKPEDTPPAESKPGESHRSGRVTFDSRGNAVWEWQTATGEFGRNVDTRRLKKLEAKELKIADDPFATQPVKKGDSSPPPRKTGGGFDPYNSGPGGKTGAFDPYNSAGSGLAPRQQKPAQKPKDLKRLSEWIKLQKSMGKKPRDED